MQEMHARDGCWVTTVLLKISRYSMVLYICDCKNF